MTIRTLLALGLAGGLLVSAPARADSGPPTAQASDRRERAAEILRQMLPPKVATSMQAGQSDSAFGADLSRLAFENAYVQLWTRPGLELKERSLVTIAMLIALGNEKELAVHFAAGLRNGLTERQLEEVIYQSTAYVGFPRASGALAVAQRVISEQAPAKADK